MLPICRKPRFFKFARTPYYSRAWIMLFCSRSHCLYFFSRIDTFFRTSIDFLRENFEKIEFFKNFHFRQFFGLRRATFILSFTLARSYRLIWNLDRNIGHDQLYPEITSNWKLNVWTPFKIHTFILKTTDLSQISFFQVFSNTILI